MKKYFNITKIKSQMGPYGALPVKESCRKAAGKDR